MTTNPIPDEAVEAALRVRAAYEDGGCDDAIEGGLEAAAPIIAAQAVADLRTRIEALRDEWRSGMDERCGCATCAVTRIHADDLDALVGGK